MAFRIIQLFVFRPGSLGGDCYCLACNTRIVVRSTIHTTGKNYPAGTTGRVSRWSTHQSDTTTDNDSKVIGKRPAKNEGRLPGRHTIFLDMVAGIAFFHPFFGFRQYRLLAGNPLQIARTKRNNRIG